MVKDDKNKVTVTLYGDILDEPEQWWKWFLLLSKFSVDNLSLPLNHMAVTSNKSFKSGKINLIEKVENKFKKAVEESEIISSIELYSLPSEFKQAAFDHNTFMVRYKGRRASHITYTFSKSDFEQININQLIEISKPFIGFSHGEIFEMSVLESPIFYASKANPASSFKTLNILEVF